MNGKDVHLDDRFGPIRKDLSRRRVAVFVELTLTLRIHAYVLFGLAASGECYKSNPGTRTPSVLCGNIEFANATMLLRSDRRSRQ